MLGLAVAAALSAFVPHVAVGPRAAARSQGPVMMPRATPKVPYKYPNTNEPQWIDVYNRMYRERIMFLGQDVEDDFANTIIAVLLYLEMESTRDPISMYINSSGGSMKAGLALQDTMRIMPYDIQTVNLGMCASVSTFIVAAGTKGKRVALPNSRFFMQNPRINPSFDREGKPFVKTMQASEMKLEVEEVVRDKKRMLDGFAGFTGRPIETLREDFKRDFYLDAKEAVEYGLVDKLLLPKNLERDPSLDPNLTEAKFGAFSSGDEQQFGGETWGLKQKNEERKGASFDAPLDGGGGGDGPATA